MTKLKITALAFLLLAIGCFFSLFMPMSTQNKDIALASFVCLIVNFVCLRLINAKVEIGGQTQVLEILTSTFGIGLLVLACGVLGFWGFEALFNVINKTDSQVLSLNKALCFALMDLGICYYVAFSRIACLQRAYRC